MRKIRLPQLPKEKKEPEMNTVKGADPEFSASPVAQIPVNTDPSNANLFKDPYKTKSPFNRIRNSLRRR